MKGRWIAFGCAAGMAVFSSAQSRWDMSLVGVTNIGDPGGIHSLDFQSSNVGAQSTATVSNVQFTGLDGSNAMQTMSFSGTTVTSAQYGFLHSYTSGSLSNSYHNASNSTFWNTGTGQPNADGSPDSLTSLGFAGFSDVLHFGGVLQAGYRARYVFHVDGDNSGVGALADMGVSIAGNPAESFFAAGNGHFDEIWATHSYEVNGITPQSINVQFSNQVVFDTPNITDGSNVWGISDFGATLTLARIEMVDASGNLVGGWTVESDSGTHYNTVPEPASLAVLGLGLLCLRRRRAR